MEFMVCSGNYAYLLSSLDTAAAAAAAGHAVLAMTTTHDYQSSSSNYFLSFPLFVGFLLLLLLFCLLNYTSHLFYISCDDGRICPGDLTSPTFLVPILLVLNIQRKIYIYSFITSLRLTPRTTSYNPFICFFYFLSISPTLATMR